MQELVSRVWCVDYEAHGSLMKKSQNKITFFYYLVLLQEALKVLRLVDDAIIYKLNTSIPTDSFVGEINAEQKCQELYNEVNEKQYRVVLL